MGIDKRVKKRHHKQMAKRPPPPGISRHDWDATPKSVQILVYTFVETKGVEPTNNAAERPCDVVSCGVNVHLVRKATAVCASLNAT
jgi:hypothetical protein